FGHTRPRFSTFGRQRGSRNGKALPKSLSCRHLRPHPVRALQPVCSRARAVRAALGDGASHRRLTVAKEDRGFASMERTKQRESASKGGKAEQQKGTAHEWTSEEAREAGRKGGMASHRRKQQLNESTIEPVDTLAPPDAAPDRGAPPPDDTHNVAR